MRRPPPWIVAGLCYLGLGAALWWHGWGSTWLGVGYGDPSQEVWYFAWMNHALAHGLDPFVSHAMFAPQGLNMMLNTSILLPAFVLSPVTALFGPLVTFDVAVVLAPTISALAGFVAFRRYAPYGPAAFLGGLFYGFSPFLLHDLSAGHLHITTMPFPPLILLVLNDIAVRRKGSAVRGGVLLGLLVAAQFLTSLEVLATTVVLSVAGLALLALRHRHEVVPRLRRVAAALAVAAGVSLVLLAYPLWVLVAGPRRYHGSVFPDTQGLVAVLRAVVWPVQGLSHLPQDSNVYIGIPLIALLAIGCWRCRSGALRFAGAMALVSLVLSLGRSIHLTVTVGTHIPLPGAVLAKLPELNNILPIRYSAFVAFFAAMGLAVAVDRIRAGELTLTRRSASDEPHADGPPAPASTDARRRSAIAVGIGVLAIASPVLGAPVPFAVAHDPMPAVYRSVALSHLPSGSTVLTYPVPNGFFADELLWQAEAGITYNQVAGYGFIPGPGPHPLGSLPTNLPVTNALGLAQFGLLPPTPPPGEVAAMRAELRAWGVTDIVLRPVGNQMGRLVALVTEVARRPPKRIAGAWVWLDVRSSELR